MNATRVVMLAAVVGGACGSETDPVPGDGSGATDVRFGDTALVVVLNPVVNDVNSAVMPSPGVVREGIALSVDDGTTATTDASGIAVLGPLEPGTRTVTLSGGLSGTFSVEIDDGALHEIALAADGGRAEIMVEIDYKTDQVVEISPAMSNQQVNDVLADSDAVVFVPGGTYVGDLDFSGSRVTLFGEGVLGGTVTIDGNVTISGSDSRIRGARITGNLSVPASGVGVSFSRVEGDTDSDGSDATLLVDAMCGAVSLTGSDTVALDVTGASPLASCR